MKTSLSFLFPFALLIAGAAIPAHAASYKLEDTIQIGGTGGWDYLTADAQGRRLYVSHGSQVEVIDLDSQKPVGKISGLSGIHGIAIASDLGVGFISDGRNNEVVEFSLKDLSIQRKIKAGTNPDGIVYDAPSKQVFAFNGRSQDATAINASAGSVTGTIQLGGKPEFPVSDGKGSVFANIEDKNEIVKINAKTLAVEAHWPVTPCESPSGLAIDKANRRLFAVCDNKLMAVVDANSGKVVATPAIGDGPDAAAFDPETRMAFSSNGQSGTVTVVRTGGKDEYFAETIDTEKGARTMALDEKTHKLYLSTASFGPAPAATAASPRPRPAILPDSFRLIVLGQ